MGERFRCLSPGKRRSVQDARASGRGLCYASLMTVSPQSLPGELLELERKFWSADAEFYRRHVDERCLLVFAPFSGLLSTEEVAMSIAGGSRWEDVEIGECHSLALANGTVRALSYTAHARRGDSERYSARVTSLYVRRDTGWKLAVHQHTPIEPV